MDQAALPTMEKPKPDIPELIEIGKKYREAVDERLKIQKEREIPYKKRILELMHEHQLTEYHDGSVSIELTVKDETVHVTIDDDEGPPADE